jgi:Ca-activated chloride channel homolog
MAVFLTSSILAREPDNNGVPGMEEGTQSMWISALDPLGRSIVNLEKDQFRIYEDEALQTITSFRKDPAKAGVGILLDVSSSMRSVHFKETANKAILNSVRNKQWPADYFLLRFHRSVEQVSLDSTEAILPQPPASSKQESGTALYDAIYEGCQQLKKSNNDLSALIIISDGEENNSKHRFSEILKLAQDSEIQVYIIMPRGLLNSSIHKLVTTTGGRAFITNSFNELDYYFNLIQTALHRQYRLSYTPARSKHDGKWRKIKIDVPVPPKAPKIELHYKQGYFSPKN